VLCIVAGASLAALSAYFFGRSKRSREGEYAASAFSFVGGVLLSSFILVTGFLIVGSWQLQTAVRSHAHEEARAVAKLYARAGALPVEQRDSLRAGLTTYTRTVIGQEWPQMRDRRMSTQAWWDLDQVRDRFREGAPGKMTPAYDEANKALEDLYVRRYTRAADLTVTTPPIMLAALVVAGALVILYPLLVGIPANRRNIAIMGCVGVIVGFGLYLVIALQDPFSPPVSIGPDGFEDALRRFTRLP
jgi:hypothetical protein